MIKKGEEMKLINKLSLLVLIVIPFSTKAITLTIENKTNESQDLFIKGKSCNQEFVTIPAKSTATASCEYIEYIVGKKPDLNYRTITSYPLVSDTKIGIIEASVYIVNKWQKGAKWEGYF